MSFHAHAESWVSHSGSGSSASAGHWERVHPEAGSLAENWTPNDDDSFILDVGSGSDGEIQHRGENISPVMVDGAPAVIAFTFDTPSDDYYCVFDFGDTDGRYGVTLSGHFTLNEPEMDDDGNLVAIYIIDYETGEWHQVLITGSNTHDDDATEFYDFHVYAEPGQMIRWISYTDDDMQLNMAAEVTFGAAEPPAETECAAGDSFDNVHYFPALNRWVTTVDQGDHPRFVAQDGTAYWVIENHENRRNLAPCSSGSGSA
jgi:hypothetical protein